VSAQSKSGVSGIKILVIAKTHKKLLAMVPGSRMQDKAIAWFAADIKQKEGE
jgi:hypothetical protein